MNDLIWFLTESVTAQVVRKHRWKFSAAAVVVGYAVAYMVASALVS